MLAPDMVEPVDEAKENNQRDLARHARGFPAPWCQFGNRAAGCWPEARLASPVGFQAGEVVELMRERTTTQPGDACEPTVELES
jgi:hypothetical protein